MKRINSEYFRWDNSIRKNYISIKNIFIEDQIIDDSGTYCILKKSVKFIGYCDADKLSVLPKSNGYALMIEFPNGEEYWVHNTVLPKPLDNNI